MVESYSSLEAHLKEVSRVSTRKEHESGTYWTSLRKRLLKA